MAEWEEDTLKRSMMMFTFGSVARRKETIPPFTRPPTSRFMMHRLGLKMWDATTETAEEEGGLVKVGSKEDVCTRGSLRRRARRERQLDKRERVEKRRLSRLREQRHARSRSFKRLWEEAGWLREMVSVDRKIVEYDCAWTSMGTKRGKKRGGGKPSTARKKKEVTPSRAGDRKGKGVEKRSRGDGGKEKAVEEEAMQEEEEVPDDSWYVPN